MIDTLVPRTLVALSLVVMPAVAAAQTSPTDADSEAAAEDTSDADASEQPEEPESTDEDQGETAEEETAEEDSDEETSGEESGEAADPEAQSESTEQEQLEGEGAADSEDPESEQPESEQTQGQTPSTSPPEAEEMQPTTSETAPSEQGEDEEGEKGSPIADLADSEKGQTETFEPVRDIDEQSLEELTPAEVYPYLEWDGLFRVRSDAAVNFDLGTRGTSAVLPPAENDLPSGDAPANPDADLLWGTDMGLRLEPTIHISEGLRVHVESAILENVVFGSLSDRRWTRPGGQVLRPDPSRTVYDSNQIPPREREWFEDSLQINEVWGEFDMFLGELRAGRMDNHWGLGMHANSGDCNDCNYGDHVDRIRFLTKPFGFYTTAAIDFPDQGPTSQAPDRVGSQAYDLAQIDDARQYTFSIFKKPRSDRDEKLQQKKLKEDQIPAFNGGARFTLRSQKGVFTPPETGTNPEDGELVYRGLNMYVPDLWIEFLYDPDPDTYIRVALEGVGVFGSVDNATTDQVGTSDGADAEEPINCFDEGTRNANPERCTSTENIDDTTAGIAQFGTALESELYFGGPVRFGLNGGFASGGDEPNWGYQASNGAELDFYRFDPNYHVDLILFREVMGTVTNAYYANPYGQARFFESPDQRMEVQLDAIASRAVNIEGTPAGRDGGRWLGFELDGAVRYLQIDRFQAGLEGGILFPFGGLDARLDRQRLTQPFEAGGRQFNDDASSSIAWTVQGNLYWKF